MSFGKDLQEFVQSFSAGYNMIGQSQKDKAAMEESKARTENLAEQTKLLPIRAAYEQAQTRAQLSRADWWDRGAPHTAIKGDPNSTLEGSTANALGGGTGAIPDATQDGPAQQYAPGDMTAPPPVDTSADALPSGFDDTNSSSGAADTSATSDQANYAPTPDASSGAIPDYRTAAPTQPAGPPSVAPGGLAQLFPAVDQKYNLPPGYAQTVSAIETGHTYDPSIVNPSSQAAGLFQFMPSTAKGLGIDPLNPASAAHGFGQLTNANQQILTKALGRPPTAAELYLAHQQGPAAAGLMINHPTMSAMDVLTHVYQQAGAKNPQAIAQQALTGNGGQVGMTAGQFAGKWMSQFNRENARVTGQGNQQVATANPAPNPGATATDAGSALASTGDPQVDANLADLGKSIQQQKLDYAIPQAGGAAPATPAVSAVNAVGNNPVGKPVPLSPLQAGVKAGLGAVSDRFAPQGNGAVPAGQGQPNVQGYLSGDTAAQNNVVQQLRKIVPGAAKMNDGEFGAAAISFIMQSDKLQPAQRAQAVGDLLQFYRNGFNQYAAIAKAAVQSGNIDDAVKASIKAYMHIPDGQSVTAEKQDDSGKYMITFKNDKTGAVTSQQLLSPAEMGGQIMKTTPVLFDQALSQMVATPEKPTTITDQGRAAASSLANPDTDPATALGQAKTPADVVAIRDAATAQDKGSVKADAAQTRAETLLTNLGASISTPGVTSQIGGNMVGAYTDALSNNATGIKAGVEKALRSKNVGDDELMDMGKNIMFVDPKNPDAPPNFQITKENGKSTVTWDNGDSSLTVPNTTAAAFLAVRHEVIGNLKKGQIAARNAKGIPDPNDVGGPDVRSRPAAPNSGNQAATDFGGSTQAIPSTMMEVPKQQSPDDYIAPKQF